MEEKRECFGKYVNSSSVCYECCDEAVCIERTYDIKREPKKTYIRPTKNDYYLDIALSVSKRSNCLKRHYGCIIVKNDEIIATGYNGSPRGEQNCCDKGYCQRLNKEHNSGDYSDCFSVHAEQNAMLSASRKDMIGSTMYLSCEENGIEVFESSPCPICEKLIKNSGIEMVVNKNGIVWERK